MDYSIAEAKFKGWKRSLREQKQWFRQLKHYVLKTGHLSKKSTVKRFEWITNGLPSAVWMSGVTQDRNSKHIYRRDGFEFALSNDEWRECLYVLNTKTWKVERAYIPVSISYHAIIRLMSRLNNENPVAALYEVVDGLQKVVALSNDKHRGKIEVPCEAGGFLGVDDDDRQEASEWVGANIIPKIITTFVDGDKMSSEQNVRLGLLDDALNDRFERGMYNRTSS